MKASVRTAVAAALLGVAPVAQSAGAPFECLSEPSQVIEVRTPVDGLIEKVHVDRGDRIRRGQPLVELSSDLERSTVDSALYRMQMEGQIAVAQNRLDYAVRKLARTTELAQSNFLSAQGRDDAESERRVAASELQVAKEARELATIEYRRAVNALALRSVSSPIDGVVLDRMLHPGDLAEAGSGRRPVLKIAQVNPLRIDIVLPAKLFGRVKAGTKVVVSFRGVPGRHPVEVKMVDRVIDAASGTFVARLELPNPSADLPGGMRCEAEIEGVPNPAARIL